MPDRTTRTYRIRTWGDGAHVETVTGDWDALVKAVTDCLTFKPTPDDLIDTHLMLTEGEAGPGWDGRRVVLTFEDGGIEVELA